MVNGSKQGAAGPWLGWLTLIVCVATLAWWICAQSFLGGGGRAHVLEDRKWMDSIAFERSGDNGSAPGAGEAVGEDADPESSEGGRVGDGVADERIAERSIEDHLARMDAAVTLEELADLAAILVEFGDRNSLQALFRRIDASEGEVRDTLSRSLQALRDSRLVPDLLKFLRRHVEDGQVADQASDALARILMPGDLHRLEEALEGNRDGGSLERRYLLRTIARVHSSEAVGALAALCWGAQQEDVHAAAAGALGAIGTPEAIEALIGYILRFEIADHDSPVVRALLLTDNKDSVAMLQEQAAVGEQPIVREVAARVLGRIRSQEGPSL